MRITRIFLAVISILFFAVVSPAEDIGSVNTAFNLLEPDHKIVIEAFDDPLVAEVTCHVSYSKKDGVKEGLGLAEETSDASIACRQIGPINIAPTARDGEDVFAKSRSFWFKKIHDIRFFDRKRNVIVYLAYSNKLVEGSPKNSISSVPIMPWGAR